MGWIRAVRALRETVVVVVVVGGAACARPATPASEQQGTEPGANNVILAAALVNMPTTMPASELPDSASPGAQLVAKFCAQACHGIPAPTSHSAQDWPVVLRRMWLRMDNLDSAYHILVPTAAERILILDYLLGHGLVVTNDLLPDAPGRLLFGTKCGACHGLPDLRQHSAEDWASVVRRMNGKMQKLLGTALSQDEMQRIVLYLQAASRS